MDNHLEVSPLAPTCHGDFSVIMKRISPLRAVSPFRAVSPLRAEGPFRAVSPLRAVTLWHPHATATLWLPGHGDLSVIIKCSKPPKGSEPPQGSKPPKGSKPLQGSNLTHSHKIQSHELHS